MEGYLFKWLNFIKGWKPRYVILDNTSITISKNKGDLKNESILLTEAKLIDEKKKKNFLIETSNKKLYFKLENEEQKQAWIAKFNELKNNREKENFIFEKDITKIEIIQENQQETDQMRDQKRFSIAYNQYQEEINKQNVFVPLDNVVKNLLLIQNLLFELTYCIEDYKSNINHKNINKEDLFKTLDLLTNIKNEMKVIKL